VFFLFYNSFRSLAHRRTFMEAPPKTSDFAALFVFDDARVALATVMLDLDKDLARWRWDVVPTKIREETFWCHYFYRVELIVDAVKTKAETEVSHIVVVQSDECDDVAVTPLKTVLVTELPERRSAITNHVEILDDYGE
jgi:hypothetical protein